MKSKIKMDKTSRGLGQIMDGIQRLAFLVSHGDPRVILISIKI